MASLSIDYYLRALLLVVYLLNPALQLKYYGACGIYDVDVSLVCRDVGLGRFSVSTQQDFRAIGELTESLMVDRTQTKVVKTLTFTLIVDNVAQTV